MNGMKKRLIIGDIHGHFDHVKGIYNLEKPDEVICLGDYVDSFVQNPEDHKNCLNELLALRKRHNDTHGKRCTFHLLMGNHDFHYIYEKEKYSGYNDETSYLCKPILRKMLDDNVLKVVYVDEINRTIYSHAGISSEWMKLHNVHSLGFINDVSFDCLRFTYREASNNAGESKYSSPIWIRPYSLGMNLYSDEQGEWRQVVGHTNVSHVIDFEIEKFTTWKEHIPVIICDSLPHDYLVEYLDDTGKLMYTEIKEYMYNMKGYQQ